MASYKKWNFEVSHGQVRISGYGTSGTFATQQDAINWIDANFP